MTFFCDYVGSVWQIQFGITGPMREFRENFAVDKAAYQRFRADYLPRAIRLHPGRGRQYVSAAHTEAYVDETLSVFDDVLADMARA